MEKEKKQQDKSPKKRKQETYSFKEWEDIMGKNKPTYGRNRHGAVTNKRK